MYLIINCTKSHDHITLGHLHHHQQHHHHHHHHISVMGLGHLLTRSGLTYPEFFSKVCHDSFCQLGNSISLPWVIYYGPFVGYVSDGKHVFALLYVYRHVYIGV